MGWTFRYAFPLIVNTLLQIKLEAQYNAKRETQLNEVSDLKQQLELRNTEIRNLNASIDSLKSVNEELKVGPFRPSSRSSLTQGHSERLPLPPLGSRAERILLRVLKISSGHARLSTFSWLNSTV